MTPTNDRMAITRRQVKESELVHHADRSQEADRSRRGDRGDLSRCQP